MKQGYLAEVGLHKEELKKAMTDDDFDLEACNLDDLQDMVDTLTQTISNYTAAAGSITKLLATWYDSSSVKPNKYDSQNVFTY